MTDRHPLTETILQHVDTKNDFLDIDAIDEAIREHLTPKPVVAESGVRFVDTPDTLISVAAQFLESGNQLQMALIGVEPVLLIQPEYDADEDEVTFVTTAVDLDPAALVKVLEALLDGAREIVRIQSKADEDFELAQLPETPEG